MTPELALLESERKALKRDLKYVSVGSPEEKRLLEEIADIESQIREIGDGSAPGDPLREEKRRLLRDQLLRFNYGKQIKLFRDVIHTHRAAAFLIHGPLSYGQSLLVHRLARLKMEWTSGQYIHFDAGSRGLGKSTRNLWRQLALRMQLGPNCEQDEILDNLETWLKTQHVILTVDSAEAIPKDILDQWFNRFWIPLAERMRNAPPNPDRKTYLLLFLVDYVGKVPRFPLPWTRDCTENNIHSKIVLLPEITPFPEIELDFLSDTIAEILPGGLNVAALAGEPVNGIPERVYEKICEHCGFTWEGDITI